MNFVNLTPHELRIENTAGEIVTLPTSGAVARLATTQETVEKDGFKFSRTIYGAIENLPEMAEGVIYVTSMLVAQAASRPDVVSPDSGPTAQRVKEGPEKGQIEFVRGFVTY